VYEWEKGRCIPRLFKLVNISAYFGVSLDCLINGKQADGNILEEWLSRAEESETIADVNFRSTGRLISRFHSLPTGQKERLIGYLDALCREC